ncbi:hypothetical protein PENSPDRAFT_640856 [Peniophora sp. CONT]|nr:hypothetical protein PENSPDRAFT_640856 [Peniophora sp. CONT]
MASFMAKLLVQYPDDDNVKNVFLRADGKTTVAEGEDRHVLIYWENGTGTSGQNKYIQILQLSGGPGNYNFYPDMMITQSEADRARHTFYELGQYTRAQRDNIKSLAGGVKYLKSSRINSCRTWTRDLFEVMVAEDLITQAQFDYMDVDVPLRKRLSENMR